MKKYSLIYLLSIMLIVSLACGTSTSDSTTEPKDKQGEETSAQIPTEKIKSTETQAPTDTPKPTSYPTHTINPNAVTAGTYLVGEELKPGLYFGEEDDCYWERLKDLSGNFDSIIANGNSNGQFYIQVKEDDAAISTSCSIVLLDPIPTHSGDYPQSIEPGMFMVGLDIKPGIYKGFDPDCYWERLKDVEGGFNSIITNGNSYGQFYVKVKEGDFALSTSCNIELLDPIPAHTGDYPQLLQPGLYLVGTDIQPGTYKGNSADCYWERLKDLDGSFNSIIANDISEGQFYVKVSDTDFALSTSCEIERTGD